MRLLPRPALPRFERRGRLAGRASPACCGACSVTLPVHVFIAYLAFFALPVLARELTRARHWLAQEWAARAWPEISAAGGLPGLGVPGGAEGGGAPSARLLHEMLAAQLHPHARAPAPLGAAGFPAVPLDGRHR